MMENEHDIAIEIFVFWTICVLLQRVTRPAAGCRCSTSTQQTPGGSFPIKPYSLQGAKSYVDVKVACIYQYSCCPCTRTYTYQILAWIHRMDRKLVYITMVPYLVPVPKLRKKHQQI